MAESKRGKAAKSSNGGKNGRENKASNTAGKVSYETVRLCSVAVHGKWKDVFAPVLKGFPYNIQSKEGGGDSGNGMTAVTTWRRKIMP
jgi:hypothetical protein